MKTLFTFIQKTEYALLNYLSKIFLKDTKTGRKTKLKQFLKHRSVSVNGRVTTRFDHPVKPGDEVRIETSKARALTPASQFNLEIVYEDPDLIVINKPAGLITHQKNIDDKQPSVVDWVIEDYPKLKDVGEPFIASGYPVPRAGIVHRLDKDTSGLLLIAKNNEAFFYFKNLFQTRKIKKHYLALVHGRPKEPKGIISSPLGRIGMKRTTQMTGKKLVDGKESVTEYRSVWSSTHYAYVWTPYAYDGFEDAMQVILSDIESQNIAVRCDYVAPDDDTLEPVSPTQPEPESCPPDYPYLWSDGQCYDQPESNYLDNGCPVDYPYLWSDGQCYDQPESVLPTQPEPETTSLQTEGNGGCLIATATFGSELAPQVQFLREIRDNTVLSTASGASFMTTFNSFYYSFSPTIADLERQNPVFKETVKVAITPLLSSLSLLQYADIDSEAEMLGYGIGIILLNIGMYFIGPAFLIVRLKSKFSKIYA